MASCYYATLVGGQCGPSSYNPSIVECVTIKDCNKDILNHCSQYKIKLVTTVACLEVNQCYFLLVQVTSPNLMFIFHPLTLLTYCLQILKIVTKTYRYSLGIFEIDESYMKMTVCPLHRDLYGIRWRCNKTRCSIRNDLAAHKSLSVKAQCGLTTLLSSFIFNKTKILIPVGTGTRLIYSIHLFPAYKVGRKREKSMRIFYYACTSSAGFVFN